MMNPYGPPQMPAPVASCPRCHATGALAPGEQRCPACRRAFTFYLGSAADPSAVPPLPDFSTTTLSMRWSNVFLTMFAKLEPIGVASGTNDPITGMIPMDKSGVLFQDIISVTLWRGINWMQIVATVLLLVPLSLGLSIGAVLSKSLVLGLVALIFLALTAWAIYLGAILGTHHARILGRYRVIDLRYDAPFYRRKRFEEELLRRAGLVHNSR